MQSDPIVEEIHRVREQMANRFGYDIRAIGQDAHEREVASDRKVIRRPSRSPVKVKSSLPPTPAVPRG